MMSPVHLAQILDLVTRATDQKLLQGRSQAALSLLAQADTLCQDHPELPPAIQGLVAYRMGHLRMRQGSDVAALLNAQQEFQLACQHGEGLEPWAGLYHLAVLGRLNALRPDPDIPASIQRRLDTQWQDVVHEQANLDPTAAPDRDDPIVQRGSLNATEALAYALGLDPAGLEGQGSLEHSLHLGQDWGFLVGPQLADAQARLPRAMLTPMLMQIRERNPRALCFTLPAPEHTPLLWRPGQEQPEPLGRKRAAVLCWVLQGWPGGNRGLERSVYGRPAAVTRRKLIQRTRDLLAEVTGHPRDLVLQRDPEDRPQIAPDLEIYGAVHGDHWRHG